MFFSNLTLYEFLGLFTALSGVMAALYLLDRLRKKRKVASLRFFAALERVPQFHHRSKFQQPWSLLLQLLSLLLLLLAIADLKLGSPAQSSRDHVLVLDTSAWMAARSGQGRLIDRARADAKAYVAALPPGDRVMLVRAGALATPATLFESGRREIDSAIDESQPSAAVLNIGQALDLAAQTQKLDPQRAGEIAFVGAGRVASGDGAPPALPANLRVISTPGPAENTGLRKLSVRQSLADPDAWDIYAAVKNYGAGTKVVPLVITFGGAPVGTRRFTLAPDAEDTATFHLSTRAAGWLEAHLLTREPFTLDDSAKVELPARANLPVTIYTDQPELLRPVFNAIPEVRAEFLPVSSYAPATKARIVVLDRFSPPEPPSVDSVWIDPPSQNSAIAVRKSDVSLKLTRWSASHPLASGLRVRDLELDKAEVFDLGGEDVSIAEADEGPVIAARDGAPKMVFLGFHPVLSSLKYELATPLLFANILHWMAPGIFTGWELNAGSPGLVNVDLDSEADPAGIRVLTQDQRPLPFSAQGKSLRFFAGSPGIVRVSTGERELVYSLTLPQPGDVVWKPAGVRTGIPRKRDYTPASRDLWHWLALAGAAGLLIDWLLFGRGHRRIVFSQEHPRRIPWRKAS